MDTQYKDIIADIDRLVKELVDILPDSFINKENLIGNFIRIRNFVAHHNISTTLLYNILSLIKHINTLIIEKKNYSRFKLFMKIVYENCLLIMIRP